RFYENPAPSADFIAQYDAFFKRYSESARFNQNGYEVRVYKIGAPELPTNRVAARFGIYAGWVELVGYDLRALVWASGETQRIGFYWRALVARKESLTLTARVIDSTGRELSFSRGPLFGDAYAVGAWPESIARSGLDIIVPPSALSGLYRVQLEVEGEGIGRVPLLSYTNQAVSDKLFIGPFKVTGPPLARDEVAKSNPVNANFAKQIALLGYTLSPPLARAGDPITLTCYWRADLKMDENYSVFVHLLDPRGAVRAQIDSQPRGGLYPTSIWDRGEIVRDDYVLKLPADFAPGEYRISIGWYAFPSLARLGMSDSTGRLLDDHLILDQVVTVK
ncbi:MAG: hypothetical protein HY257_03660, partial [Chloroflexi bacterium]|nr:hypothetical protein [Chloroflexota bacterium]